MGKYPVFFFSTLLFVKSRIKTADKQPSISRSSAQKKWHDVADRRRTADITTLQSKRTHACTLFRPESANKNTILYAVCLHVRAAHFNVHFCCSLSFAAKSSLSIFILLIYSRSLSWINCSFIVLPLCAPPQGRHCRKEERKHDSVFSFANKHLRMTHSKPFPISRDPYFACGIFGVGSTRAPMPRTPNNKNQFSAEKETIDEKNENCMQCNGAAIDVFHYFVWFMAHCTHTHTLVLSAGSMAQSKRQMKRNEERRHTYTHTHHFRQRPSAGCQSEKSALHIGSVAEYTRLHCTVPPHNGYGNGDTEHNPFQNQHKWINLPPLL